MNMLKRANARLAGLRLSLLAFVFTLPDILSALVGFDWTPLLPAGHEGLGVRIGCARRSGGAVAPANPLRVPAAGLALPAGARAYAP